MNKTLCETLAKKICEDLGINFVEVLTVAVDIVKTKTEEKEYNNNENV